MPPQRLSHQVRRMLAVRGPLRPIQVVEQHRLVIGIARLLQDQVRPLWQRKPAPVTSTSQIALAYEPNDNGGMRLNTRKRGGSIKKSTAQPRLEARLQKGDSWQLPGVVRRPVRSIPGTTAMHVADSGLLLVHAHRHVFLLSRPVLLVGTGVGGNFFKIAGRNQILQRLRCPLLVECVLYNLTAHRIQVLVEHRLTRRNDRLLVAGNGNGKQDHDDRDHDHHLNQREARGVLSPPYHSLYFVSSNAVSSDLV